MNSSIHITAFLLLLWLPQSAQAVTAYVDSIQMTVYYTEAATVPVFPWVLGVALTVGAYALIHRYRSTNSK